MLETPKSATEAALYARLDAIISDLTEITIRLHNQEDTTTS